MSTLITSHTKQTFRIFWRHILTFKWHAFATTILFVVSIIPGLLVPKFYKEFFDQLADSNLFSATQMSWLLGIILLKIFAANLVKSLLWGIAAMGGNWFSSKVAGNLTNTCFNHLLSRSHGFFNNNQIGALVQKITRFIRAYEQLYDEFTWKWLPLVIETLATFAIISYRSYILGVILLIWTILFCVISYIFSRIKLPYDLNYSAIRSKVTGQLVDSVSNHDAIKLFSAHPQEQDSFHAATKRQFSLKILSENIGEIFGIIQSVMIFVLEFAIYFFAIRLWQQGLFTIGDFIMIQGFLVMMFRKLIEFQKLFRNVFKYLAYAQEMTSVLIQQPEIKDIPDAQPLIVTHGDIRFEHINFHYHTQQQVLHDINLHIRSGERIALVGGSGSGKSTLIKLLLRFFEAESGSINIDGVNIHNVQHASLCSQISLVPQEPILFHRSIQENIRYGKPDATDQEVWHAAQQANCLEFINQLPDGFDTLVGERGSKLSGGQRQRITIARAILKNAPILVLDEATNSLDSHSEALVQEAISRLIVGKTVIVIAHQLASIAHVDRIVVLHNGRIVEEGSHKALLARNGHYHSLWQTQHPLVLQSTTATSPIF